mgnify:CR=1 FL=1
MSKRIAVFVDVQNIYYTTRQAYGRQFDYRKLWQRISTQGEIISATAYAIHRGDSQQLKFQNALKDIGFTVKLKPYIQRSDGSAKAGVGYIRLIRDDEQANALGVVGHWDPLDIRDLLIYLPIKLARRLFSWLPAGSAVAAAERTGAFYTAPVG